MMSVIVAMLLSLSVVGAAELIHGVVGGLANDEEYVACGLRGLRLRILMSAWAWTVACMKLRAMAATEVVLSSSALLCDMSDIDSAMDILLG